MKHSGLCESVPLSDGGIEGTGLDRKEIGMGVAQEAVFSGPAEFFVMSEEIRLPADECAGLIKKCHDEAAEESCAFVDDGSEDGALSTSRRVVIAVGNRPTAVRLSMRCHQASGGQIRFRVLEAATMYASFDYQHALQQLFLNLPMVERVLHRVRDVMAGGMAYSGPSLELHEAARTLRPMIDEIERVLTEATKIEDEKRSKAVETIRAVCGGGTESVYELKASTSLRSVVAKAAAVGQAKAGA